MRSKVSQGKLESSVGAIYDDFDSDESVWANWRRLRCLSSHGGHTISSGQVAVKGSLSE